jgi:hypothetical protein
MIAKYAAGRYCELHHIDPDDDAIFLWNEGKMTDARLLNTSAKNLIREQSRQIAVTVATTVWKINRKEGHLEVSVHYDAFCEVLSKRLADIITQADFETETEKVLQDL